MAAVDSDQVSAATLLTVCDGCNARALAQRACGVCQGHGWLISTSSEYGTTVEKCDTCAVFVDDFAAATAAKISAVMHDRGIR